MIQGSVLQSRDYGRHGGFDVVAYLVAHEKQSPDSKSIWVTVNTVALQDGIELGLHCVPYVKHSLKKKKKSALNRVDKRACIEKAVADAEETLLGLIA